MTEVQQNLISTLENRRKAGTYRAPTVKEHLIDFCSNDYLGFARSALLRYRIEEECRKYPFHKIGATGSRLITGNSTYAEKLEKYIADFHRAPAAILFNSGYTANGGLFGSVPQKNELIVYDESIHASVHEGIRLSRASAVSFRHNDISDLERILSSHQHMPQYVAIESIYSMDGSQAPLEDIVGLCQKYHASLIVDEAHATGLYGPQGEGLVVQLGLEKQVFARVYTFGKALGGHGAAIVGPQHLIEYLYNYARSYIYTTALPFPSLVAIKCSYDILPCQTGKRRKIHQLISLFKDHLFPLFSGQLLHSESAIQSLLIPGNVAAKQVSAQLEEKGYYAKAILYPTVPKGTERIRFCLHAFNSAEDVIGLTVALREILNSKAGYSQQNILME